MTQTLSTAENTYNESRDGQVRHVLIWMTAKNRTTGAAESTGFWTGKYDLNFVIDGVTRLYIGAGAALSVDDIPGGVGMDIRYVSARLAVVAPEVKEAILEYDPSLGPVEIHSAAFDLATGNLVAEPRRVFSGRINESPLEEGAEGGESLFEVRMASSARNLTLTTPLFKTDAEMRRRNASDRFREHVSTAGIRTVPWGEDEIRGEVAPPPPPPPPDTTNGGNRR